MKRLHTHSQHFLRDPSLVKELLGHSTIRKDETVIDIGAGSGVISAVLATRVANVIAVEVEPKTREILTRNMRQFDNVTIYAGDFLNMPLPKGAYSIFANIPFSLSSQIIRRLITVEDAPRATYLIVQKQFARKLVATDTKHFTGQLGMLLGARYDVRIRRPLQKTDFWPHPAVDTAFIEILLRPVPRVPIKRLAAYERFTEECFADPKKFQKMPRTEAGFPSTIKPSQLSIDQWVALFTSQTHY